MSGGVWPRLTLYSACWLFVYGVWAALLWQVNIHPLFVAKQDGTAYTNIVLLIFTPPIFALAGELPVWKWPIRMFVAAAMFGCYFNSLNGIADNKDTTTAERSTKIVEFTKWKTTIEEYKTQAEQLPKPEKYVYTTEVEYNDKKQSQEDAAKKVVRECDPLFIRRSANSEDAQKVCNKDRTAEETAKRDFNAASVNYGYTKAKQDFAIAIADAEDKKSKLGVKPTYIEAAAGRLAKLSHGLVAEQDLIDFMPMLWAFLADVGFTFVPPLMMWGVRRRFVMLWGERWWESMAPPGPVVRHTPEVSVQPPPQIRTSTTCGVELTPQNEERPPLAAQQTSTPMKRTTTPERPKRKDYAVGVMEWLKGVTQTPDGERYTPTELHLPYAKFCEREGFPIAAPNIFSSIVRDQGGLTAKKIRGQDYFRVTIRGVNTAHLKIVKA